MKNPIDDHLGYWLRRASSRMMADLSARLGSVDLSVPDASVLLFIRSNPGCAQSAVGRSLGIQRANMAPIVLRLEESGWIERGQARGKTLPLAVTPAGESVSDRVDRLIGEHEAHCTAALSKAEVLMLLDILPRIVLRDNPDTLDKRPT